MVDFWSSRAGHLFTEGTVPKLTQAVARVANALEKMAKQNEIVMRFDEEHTLSVDQLEGEPISLTVHKAGEEGTVTITLPREWPGQKEDEEKDGD